VFSVVNLVFFALFTTKHTEVYTEATKGFQQYHSLCSPCLLCVLRG
jgi:hypothetical protein